MRKSLIELSNIFFKKSKFSLIIKSKYRCILTDLGNDENLFREEPYTLEVDSQHIVRYKPIAAFVEDGTVSLI